METYIHIYIHTCMCNIYIRRIEFQKHWEIKRKSWGNNQESAEWHRSGMHEFLPDFREVESPRKLNTQPSSTRQLAMWIYSCWLRRWRKDVEGIRSVGPFVQYE